MHFSMSHVSHDPAYRAGMEKSKDRSFLNLRKRLRRQAEEKYHRPTAWFGGILYFTDNPTMWGPVEVPGVQRVPKPDHEVVGYAVAQKPRISWGSTFRWSSRW